MAVISSIDGEQRLVYLDAAAAVGGVLTFHPVDDVYKEYRTRRRTDESVRQYNPLLSAAGNVAKGGGKFTPRFLLLVNGTKLVIPAGLTKVVVTGEVLTDDQSEPFDLSLLTGPLVIHYFPPEAEIISVSSGSGLSEAQDAALTAVKAKTDQLSFGVSGAVNSNARFLDNIEIIGSGTEEDPWRAAGT